MEPVERLIPYVPRLVLEWLRDQPDVRHRQVEGTLAFVDISGFTQLTERLSRKGKVGAEEMNDLLDGCFTELLAVAYDQGAGVIKWGGDAVLLLFEGERHAVRACCAAADMQRTMRSAGRLPTTSGQVTLRMSVGIHTGLIDFFLAGSLHRELVVTGPVATTTAEMEAVAEAEEVAISPATAAALDPRCVGSPRGPAFLLRSRPVGDGERSPPVENVETVDIGRCLPVEIRQHLLAVGGEPEHRPLAAAFIHFTGADELLARDGPEALADALDELMTTVQRAASEFRVSFFETDIAPSGGKIMLIAGAPTSAGTDEERMLRALLAVLAAEPRLPVRIGVNRGRIFVGDFGPPYRRTYSVKGDAVNLAARLMATAKPGQLLATDAVLERSRTMFEATPLPPFRAKGKSEPIQAYAVESLGRTERRGDRQTPFVGRERELARLSTALAAARSSNGRLVEIVAEPGMGKSTLLAALRAGSPDVRQLIVQCDEYEASTPYFPFHQLLRELLELPEGGGADELGMIVESRAPDLRAWLPLVGTAMGLVLPETPATSVLDEQFRKEQLERTVVELLGVLLLEPTLLVLEDGHWLDDASADLVRAIGQGLEARPWLVIVTRRDQGAGFAAAGADTILLEPLGEADAALLLASATADRPLPPHELALLAERAGGNPLFLTELLTAALLPGGVAELPDSVEALLMAQIDRLAPQDRRTLRSAAVVGAAFTVDLLAAADGVRLDAGSRRRLADFVVEEGGGRLRFRHALVRDAAYEGLPYRRRREVHARVGDAISARASNSEDEAELLSLHFFSAHRFEEAWRYSRIAGDRAKPIYANVEAAVFYDRALEAARGLGVPQDEVAAVSEALGDVRVRLGEFTKAGTAFRAARRKAAGDAAERARLILKEALIPWRLGRYTAALRWLGRGLRELDGVDGASASAERARLCAWSGVVRWKQGHPRQAIAWCERAIVEADASGARDALAHAYYMLDSASMALGTLESVANSERALEIYEELDDLERQAAVLNNLGVFAHVQGRWDESVGLYQRAERAWRGAGDRWSASFASANIGEVLSDQGRLGEAEPLLREALRVARASNSEQQTAWVIEQLGRLEARAGRFSEALRSLEEARAVYERAGERIEVLAATAKIAECLMLAGEWEGALEQAESVLTLAAAEEGALTLLPMLERLRGCALMQAGRTAEAHDALAKSVAGARATGLEYEVGLALDVLSALEGELSEASADLARERDEIFAHLGIVAAPMIPRAE